MATYVYCGNSDNKGSSDSHVWETFTNTISAGQTVVIDSGLLAELFSNTYHITASGSTKNRKYDFRLVNDQGSLSDSITKLGSNIKITINSVINLNNFEVRITNNELFAVNIKTAKLKQ